MRGGETAPAPTTRFTYLVKQLELAIRAEIDRSVGAFGVTTLQYTALSVLAVNPDMSSAEVARRSFVSPQAGNEMIGLLERKGLISRTPDPRNRRILRIRLSSDGRRVLRKCDAEIDRLEERMLCPLPGEAREEFRIWLAACTRALRQGEMPPAGFTP